MDKTEALQLLEKLMLRVEEDHSKVSEAWKSNVSAEFIINQKVCKIAHYPNNPLIRNSIQSYVSFLKKLNFGESYSLNSNGFNVTYRIKNTNSIEEKIEDYIEYRPEKGEVSLYKCFNDLFGIRAIVDIQDVS